HAHVHHDHVRGSPFPGQLVDGADGLFGGACFGHHLEVLHPGEKRFQADAHHFMIVDDHQSNHAGSNSRAPTGIVDACWTPSQTSTIRVRPRARRAFTAPHRRPTTPTAGAAALRKTPRRPPRPLR